MASKWTWLNLTKSLIYWHAYPELYDIYEGLVITVQALQYGWLLLLYAAQMLLHKHIEKKRKLYIQDMSRIERQQWISFYLWILTLPPLMSMLGNFLLMYFVVDSMLLSVKYDGLRFGSKHTWGKKTNKTYTWKNNIKTQNAKPPKNILAPQCWMIKDALIRTWLCNLYRMFNWFFWPHFSA